MEGGSEGWIDVCMHTIKYGIEQLIVRVGCNQYECWAKGWRCEGGSGGGVCVCMMTQSFGEW